MLGQILSLKRYFTWRELLQNSAALKKARGPLRGYVTTLCYWALMETGLFGELEKSDGLEVASFAVSRHLDPRILASLLEYLQRQGDLRIVQGSAAFTSRGRKRWRAMKPALDLFYGYEPLFATLSEQLHGNAAFGKAGRDCEVLARRESQVALGFAELGQSFLFKLMAGLIREYRFKSVIDLGCQEAELSVFLCARDPELRCLGIDHSPEMVRKAKERVERLGLASRIDVIEAEMFDFDRLKFDFSAYEVVAATDLFHGYRWSGDAKLVELFKALRKIFSGKAFLISELCLPPESRMKGLVYPFPEHELFHYLTEQRTFRPGELESLLEQAGFQVRRRHLFDKIAGRTCLLLG